MNAERLLAHYEQIADAPDAIARLRRFILDLAVRGKLVPQDPIDEPASELLKRISKEKARLGIEHVASPLGEGEVPFAPPVGWSWSRVGEVCSKTGSGSTPRGGKEVYKAAGVPFLRSQNIYDDGLRLNDVAYIDQQTHSRMSGTAVFPGDLLLNITGGSMGRCCRVPNDFKEANVSQHVAIIRTAVRGIEDFLHCLVLSPYFQAFVFDEQTGAGRGGLPKNRMDQIAVALPPLSEQHRIVAKVDELMGLCDRLEAARGSREGLRDRLAAVSLVRLNAPNPQTFQADARFALAVLPTLTTRPDQIRALRQTILNLAVRGKLVPQDPNDEPASELLKRIAKEKARLRASGEKRKEVELGGVTSADVPFSPPKGWTWVRLGELGETNIGLTYSPSNVSKTGTPVFRSSNIQNGKLDFEDLVRVNSVPKDGAMVQEGDLLICARNGSRSLVGKVALIDKLSEPSAFGAFMAIFRSRVNRYLYLFISSPLFRQVIDEVNTTTINQITQNNLRSTLAPIPPLGEQHRIVAKVDALMALCDRLEASLTATATTRRRLLDALLAEALAPVENREMEAAE